MVSNQIQQQAVKFQKDIAEKFNVPMESVYLYETKYKMIEVRISIDAMSSLWAKDIEEIEEVMQGWHFLKFNQDEINSIITMERDNEALA